MLERDTDWDEFTFCIINQGHQLEIISQHFGLNLQQVIKYRDMHRGLPVLQEHASLRPELAPFAVGFKYRSVIRWFPTEEIKRARTDYDVGQVELATGVAVVRDEPAWVLYAIPRKTPANRPLYFTAPAFP